MDKRLLILFLLILIHYTLSAQIENESNLQISYFGNLISYHGTSIGYQTPLKNWVNVKTKRQSKITKNKSLNIGADIAYYKHHDHHYGLIFSPYFSYLRTKDNGKYIQLKLGVGYHRSFVDGITYSVKDDGLVESKSHFGQNSFYNSISFDFGRDLRVTQQKPFRWFIQFGINGRYPYNKSLLPSLHTGLGVHYFLKSI